MCLIALAWRSHLDFPLIVAANRDEFHARPTAPAAWWDDPPQAPHGPRDPQLFAGRDLQSGGTWMGVTRNGRFCALTNVRDAGDAAKMRPAQAAAPSRGALVADFLNGADEAASNEPATYLRRIAADSAQYNGFNLLAGTRDQLWYTGNRGAAATALAPGIYGLSNALLDTPWPKTTALKQALGAALDQMNAVEPLQSRVSGLLPLLFQALSSTHITPDDALPQTGVPIERERTLSPAMIVSPVYGTRASTVLCIARDDTVVWEERSLSPEGNTVYTVREQFTLA